MMNTSATHVGTAQRRVDGISKVTGAATYAAEFATPDLLHGVVVSSAIAKGRIASINTAPAHAIPGVVYVFTHENRSKTAWFDYKYQDGVAPPGAPFRPLYDDEIVYSGQPIALVVAKSFEIARYAATLLRVTYETDVPHTDLDVERAHSYVPPKKRSGIEPPPKPRGDAAAAFAKADIRFENEYRVAIEHHNPMETHASVVIWNDDGSLTIHDKTQGVQSSQAYVSSVFGIAKDKVHVVSPFVGGAFGIGLRPQYQLFLAVMAARELKRSVRVELTREQMFTFGYRPETLQTVALGATADGKLQSITHRAVAGTSHFEDYQEVVVNWSGLLYRCDNVDFDYQIAKLDTYTPSDMRAPGATLGVFALETAMDELAYAAKIDPVELRLQNYADTDENAGKPFTSKALKACYRQGAERFGWAKRSAEPRSMREGRELVGWGMAGGVWEAMMMKTAARATLTADGRLEVATAAADIGTGTYTILTQIGADVLGLPMAMVDTSIADSTLPECPVEGGSWTAASAGGAVEAACFALRKRLFNLARGLDGSPFANEHLDRVRFIEGRIVHVTDADRAMPLTEVLRACKLDHVAEEANAEPDADTQKHFAGYTHSAVFVEVKLDEDLGVVRVTRIVSAIAAGKILNPKTARSQILGGVVFGQGMALTEETLPDHRLGRFMNRNLAEYHLPTHADIHDIEVIFVEEHDDKISPMGVKGLGEIGIVGTAAAIGNAIFHATGRRIRYLPITPDKLMRPA